MVFNLNFITQTKRYNMGEGEGDPLLTLVFPMETMVPQANIPPSSPSSVHFTVTIDLPTSIIVSLIVMLFFLFLYHILNGVFQWFLDIRPNNQQDLEFGETSRVHSPSNVESNTSQAAFYQAVAQNNFWVLGAIERFTWDFEERRGKRLQAMGKLPPVVNYGSQSHNDKTRVSSNDCAICLEDFEIGESCQILPDCNHIFHSNCIDIWLEKKLTCPVCRNCILDA